MPQTVALLLVGVLSINLRQCLASGKSTMKTMKGRVYAQDLEFDFLPFGEGTGDVTVPRGDDTSSGRIQLSVGMHIFGSVYTECWVNVNGVISFSQAISTFTPRSFPLASAIPLVAPFWADVDVRFAGNIFYRQATDSQTLQAAQRLLDESSSAHRGFQVEIVFVATWHQVPGVGLGTNWRNTFQCILLTDGIRTLAIFLYDSIVWTTGTASSGTPAQVGFDAGDGLRFHATPESRTAAVANLESLSNVGRPGLYIYRIDGSDFGTSDSCGANSMGVSPPYAGPLGGDLLTVVVGEECFSNQEELACVFEIDSYRQAVPAVIVDATHLRCLPPPSGRVGRASLGLSFDSGNTTVVSTPFFYVSSVQPDVTLKTADDEADARGGLGVAFDFENLREDVNITWDPAIFEDETLDIFVLPVGLDTEMNSVEVVAEGVPNTGQFSLSEVNFTALTSSSDPVGLQFILAPRAEGEERRLVGPLISIGGAIGRLAWQLARSRRAWKAASGFLGLNKLWDWITGKGFFERWLEYDFRFLPQVPCTWQVAELSPDWTVDYYCRSPETCNTAHPGSHICYRQTNPNNDGSSHQVCYLADGSMNNSPEGAGTADRAWTPGASMFDTGAFWPTMKHAFWDGLPFKLLTLLHGKEGLDLYRRYRPNPTQDNCFDDLPVPAAALGDPHITTLDGLAYTFNGAGEFWFLRVQNGLLHVQVRMEQMARGAATIITSLALRAQTGPVVQIGFSSTGLLQVLVDGEVQSFDDVLTEQSYDGGLTVAFRNSVTQPAARVVVAGLLVLTVNVASDALALVAQAFPALSQLTSGLLGIFDGSTENDLTNLNGTTLPSDATAYEIHYNFGMSWIVESALESLFTYRGSQTFEGFRNTSFQPVLLETSDFNESELEVCGANFACLFDLHVTEDPVFAAATVTQQAEFRQVVEVIEEARVILQSFNTSTSTTSSSSTGSTSTTTTSTTSSTSSTTTNTTTATTTTSTLSSTTWTSTVTTTTATSSSSTTTTVADVPFKVDSSCPPQGLIWVLFCCVLSCVFFGS